MPAPSLQPPACNPNDAASDKSVSIALGEREIAHMQKCDISKCEVCDLALDAFIWATEALQASDGRCAGDSLDEDLRILARIMALLGIDSGTATAPVAIHQRTAQGEAAEVAAAAAGSGPAPPPGTAGGNQPYGQQHDTAFGKARGDTITAATEARPTDDGTSRRPSDASRKPRRSPSDASQNSSTDNSSQPGRQQLSRTDALLERIRSKEKARADAAEAASSSAPPSSTSNVSQPAPVEPARIRQ